MSMFFEYILIAIFCVRYFTKMENDNHSVTINIPKPRVCNNYKEKIVRSVLVSNILKRTMERRLKIPLDSELLKYSVHNQKPISVNKLKKGEMTLPCKIYVKEQVSGKHKHGLGIKIDKKYKIVSTDLKKRLHVESPENDVRTVTDIDKHYFNCVNSRPIIVRTPVYKSLKIALADVLRVKSDIGYRVDEVLNNDINHSRELEIYDTSLKNYKIQVKYFDDFISEDYKKSMLLLKKWDDVKVKLQMKISEQHALASEQFTTVSRLLGLNYMYKVQQKYGRFLYFLSPPSWRAYHRDFARSLEIEAKGFDLGQEKEEASFNEILENMLTECSGNIVKPVIYFTQPAELISVFDGIEQQQMHHFDYVNHLAGPKKILKEGIKYLKVAINQESALVASTIRGYEKLLKFTNDKCAQLERRFYSILNGLFYESVGTVEILKLYSHLEFCFEKVYGEKPINMEMDMFSLAKGIEDFYMDYTKRLDGIRSGAIKKAIMQSLKTERTKFRRAKEAAKELRSFHVLERQLLKAYEPVSERSQKISMTGLVHTKTRKYSKQIDKADVRAKKESRLNDSELEYLALFTDWTEGEDTKKYIHKLEDED